MYDPCLGYFPTHAYLNPHSHYTRCHMFRLQTENGGWPARPAGRSSVPVLRDRNHSALREMSAPTEKPGRMSWCYGGEPRADTLARLPSYLWVEVQSDALQHPLRVCQGQRNAAVAGHAPWWHHEAVRRSRVGQGAACRQAGYWLEKEKQRSEYLPPQTTSASDEQSVTSLHLSHYCKLQRQFESICWK